MVRCVGYAQVICAKRTPDAVEVEAGKTYYWCTCGRSKNQVCARLVYTSGPRCR